VSGKTHRLRAPRGNAAAAVTTILVVAAALGALCSSAFAASVQIATDDAGQQYLVYSAGAGEANGVRIEKGDAVYSSFPNKYRIQDRRPNTTISNSITPGNGCAADPNFPTTAVICTVSANIYVNVYTGDGNDFAVLDDTVGSGTNMTLGSYAELGDGDDEYLDQGPGVVDEIYGEGGDDAISTKEGNDYIDGGPGSDKHLRAIESDSDFGLAGGAGDDDVYGDTGDDVLQGGDGIDLLFGEAGADRLGGGADADGLYGGDGDDQLEGPDFGLYSGAGADVYNGGAGDDVLDAADGQATSPPSADLFNGGDGVDTVDYSNRNRGLADDVDVSLDGVDNDGQLNEFDSVGPDGDVENLTGTETATSVLSGDGGPNVLASGGFSDNELYGLGGEDLLLGGYGQDVADGGHGADVFRLGTNGDVAYADDGGTADDIDCGENADSAYVDSADVFTNCEAIYGRTAAPSTPPASPPPAAIVLSITAPGNAGTVIVSSKGVFYLPGTTLGCPSGNGAACDATIVVTTAKAVNASVAAAKKKKKLTLGKAALKVAAGTSAKARIKLSKKGLRALRRLKSVKAVVKLTVRDRTGKRVTKSVRLKLKAPRKR
jgi:Ca2+-binding RTX toxin-like protein